MYFFYLNSSSFFIHHMRTLFLAVLAYSMSIHTSTRLATFHEQTRAKYEQKMQHYKEKFMFYRDEITSFGMPHLSSEVVYTLAVPDESFPSDKTTAQSFRQRLESMQQHAQSALQGFAEPVQHALYSAGKSAGPKKSRKSKNSNVNENAPLPFDSDEEGQSAPPTLADVDAEESATEPDPVTLPAAPILVVPGILGSVLEAKRVNATWLPSTCMRNTEWYKTWFDLQAISFGFTCWSEVMRLKVLSDGTTQSKPGIHIRVMQDTIKAVSCYNPSCTFTCDNTVYLQDFFRFMTTGANKNVQPEYRKNQTQLVENYVLRKNIDAIPYDFRRSMRDIRTTFFPELKARIERMYEDAGGQRVTLLGHSLGGLHGNLFLNEFVDSAWKEKYIRRFLPISVAYGGSVKALHTVLLGETNGWPLPFSWTRSLLETWCGLYAAFPRLNSTLWKNTPLVTVGGHKYYAKDTKKLLKDSGLSYIAKAFDALNTEHAYDGAPGVETHCLYSTGFRTMQEIEIDSFHDTDRDARRIVEDDNGDGSIARKSMEICSHWDKSQKQPVQTTVYRGFDHLGFMAQNEALWQQIFDITNFGLREGAHYVEMRDEAPQ